MLIFQRIFSLLFFKIIALESKTSNTTLNNIGLGKSASQSSTFEDWIATRALDGNLNLSGNFGKSCSHTEVDKWSPWWKADLNQIYGVYAVTLYNRVEYCAQNIYASKITREQCESHDMCLYRDEPMPGGYHCIYVADLYDRLSNVEIRVGNQWDFRRNTLCHKTGKWPKEKTNQTFECHQPLMGRYVSIQRKNIQGILTICEAQILGVPVARAVKDVNNELTKWQNPVTNLPGLFPHKAKMRWTPETVDFTKLHQRDKGVYLDETQISNSQKPQHLSYLILIFTSLLISKPEHF